MIGVQVTGHARIDTFVQGIDSETRANISELLEIARQGGAFLRAGQEGISEFAVQKIVLRRGGEGIAKADLLPWLDNWIEAAQRERGRHTNEDEAFEAARQEAERRFREIKRSRDIDNIRLFMRQIDTRFIDQHIEEMPQSLNDSVLDMAARLDDVVKSSGFLLYDKDVYNAMMGLHDSLAETLKYDHLYCGDPHRLSLRRCFDSGASFSAEEQAIEKINKARIELKGHMTELIGLLRERYLEIGIDETNRECAAAHAQSMSKPDPEPLE